MKSLQAMVVLAIVAMGVSAQAQSPPTAVECPENLLMVFNGEHYYQTINCTTNLLTSNMLRFPTKVKTGCANATNCNCTPVGPAPIQAEYADADEKVMTAFGVGNTATAEFPGSGTRVVKAGGKAFLITGMTIKGKTTSGSDSGLNCVIRVGVELDPSTASTYNGSLSGNTLTYNGKTYTVSLKSGGPGPGPDQSPMLP